MSNDSFTWKLLTLYGFYTAIFTKSGEVKYVCDNTANALSVSAPNNIDDIFENRYIDKICAVLSNIQASDFHQQDLPLKSKAKLWLSSRFRLIKHSDEELIIMIGNNVTNEFKKEKAVRNLMDVVEVAGELLKIGYWHLALKSQKLFWSDEVHKIHATDKREYTPTVDNALNFYHPADRDKVKLLISNAIAEKSGWVSETLRITSKSGKELFVVSSGQVRLDSEDNVVEIYGTFQDITSNESMLLERDFLAMALKETLVGMVVADENKKIIWVNSSFENMTGYALEEIKGEKLGPILQGPDTAKSAIKHISYCLANNEPVKQQILNYHKNGTPYWNELLISPIESSRGVQYYFGIQNDVTKEVEARKNLQKLNATLQEEVEARTQSLVKLNKELTKHANFDALTGCLNRRTLSSKYESIITSMSGQKGENISLIMLDIDRFKSINDSMGHHTGDIVIQTVANTIKRIIRTSEAFFRLGGEEFLIILPDTDMKDAVIVSERIREAVEKEDIKAGEFDIKTTISVGCFSYSGKMNLEEGLQAADKLLYKAKALGRNRVVSDSR